MDQEFEVQIQDLSSERKYFHQIPNIIYDLGLSYHAIHYYGLLKRMIGEGGKCFMRQKMIAQKMGCSDRQIRNLDKILSQPIEALGGKALIKITERKRESGDRAPNLIQIVDIWDENMDLMKSNNAVPKVPKTEKKTKIKEKNTAEPRSAPSGTTFLYKKNDIEEELYIKNDIVQEDEDRPLSKDIPIVSFDPDTYKLPNGQFLSSRMRNAIRKYSPEDMVRLKENIFYFEDLVTKGMRWANPEAYLQKCINNDYAGKRGNALNNKLYASFLKEQYKIEGMEVLKSVVKFNSKNVESICLNLPSDTFEHILKKNIGIQ